MSLTYSNYQVQYLTTPAYSASRIKKQKRKKESIEFRGRWGIALLLLLFGGCWLMIATAATVGEMKLNNHLMEYEWNYALVDKPFPFFFCLVLVRAGMRFTDQITTWTNISTECVFSIPISSALPLLLPLSSSSSFFASIFLTFIRNSFS